MGDQVYYVRQTGTMGRGRGRGGGRRSMSRSPTRMAMSQNGRNTVRRKGGPHARGRSSSNGPGGSRQKTFSRLIFLGASKMRSGEPGVQELSQLVEEIRGRAKAYKERGVAIPFYAMNITEKQVSFMEVQTRDVQHIPINLIHFVAADPRHSNIFSMVARGKGNRFVCHVFECNTPRQCGVITSTLSEAFRVGYENWIHVEENQRRLAERREMDMGGLDYFQEWDDHAPHGTPVVNIVERYNRGISCPRNFVRPQDELPVLPDRLIVTQGGREVNGEPSSMRYSFEDEEEEFDDYPVEEVYVRSGGGGRRRNQPVVYDVRPDWD
ncbi:low density lipoprotein receptor adapter protein 1-like isoform X1 [Asterias rubens]|uniref:low density lipoprotein receptor adapter protein 1-like isoform X1 n=1 Tax=Asterias rubens TaxID=7604 RepID=UPI001455534D|nr:low density lipoprotein receptor adapter protein 1-like isoform X1 [Asterias rubens]